MAEMTAIEYLKTLARASENCTRCKGCPIASDNNASGEGCSLYEIRYPEEAIKIVERWAKEHPVKTRADVFFEQYPNASKYDDGLPGISPCVMGFKDVDDYYCRYNDGCSECRKKYWLAPVEEDGK